MAVWMYGPILVASCKKTETVMQLSAKRRQNYAKVPLRDLSLATLVALCDKPALEKPVVLRSLCQRAEVDYKSLEHPVPGEPIAGTIEGKLRRLIRVWSSKTGSTCLDLCDALIRIKPVPESQWKSELTALMQFMDEDAAVWRRRNENQLYPVFLLSNLESEFEEQERKLTDFLRANNIKVRDRLHGSLGDNGAHTFREEIAKSCHIMPLITKRFLDNRSIQDEAADAHKHRDEQDMCLSLLQYAQSLDAAARKTKIIPIFLEPGCELPEILRSLDPCKFYDHPELSWDKLRLIKQIQSSTKIIEGNSATSTRDFTSYLDEESWVVVD